MNEIPDGLAAILKRECITSLKALELLTYEDIRYLNLPLGYQKLLRHALKSTHKYRRKKMFVNLSCVRESV